ncbi:MAG: porphobilinogen synthase [Candidatus Poribacteria bacterium]|nr:porphobilinogen synthase [Candidatus Poribacteria bacterium]MDP6747998.1 porphobilinogen synthase [Candidatus Poribacteria bacterium]MDP6998347.1 porphobilinogen synthase [Candidatus Poribacteria bacterium]
MTSNDSSSNGTSVSKRIPMLSRPRRNRKSISIRDMVRETQLHPSDLILPLFVIEGKNQKIEIESMPDFFRLSIDLIVEEAKAAYHLGVPALALFPALTDESKDPLATESTNPDGLLQRAVREVKLAVPEITVITDVAMDPYSSDGHDGLVEEGRILNDPTLDILAGMAVSQAEAGTDIVAPSDMMDGRIKHIRQALDQNGFSEVSILAYSAKYASAFYGPFRDALDSAPKHGDKKTYQMDPANRQEALREVIADVNQGADIVMVKPALAYLDVILAVKSAIHLPVAAYNVSGEYAMIKASAKLGWLDEATSTMEMLTAIKRAGADLILTYFARSIAEILSN